MGPIACQYVLQHGGDAQLLERLLDRRAQGLSLALNFGQDFDGFPSRGAGQLQHAAPGDDALALVG